VNLALTIVRDALENEATDYFLVSGDSDAAPAIREAQRLNPTGFYKAYFPPQRTSSELSSLMRLSEVIGRSKLRDSQLPPVVTSASGAAFEQPAKWRPETFLDEEGQPKVNSHTGPVTATPADLHRLHQTRK
jgi:hypothetical protein